MLITVKKCNIPVVKIKSKKTSLSIAIGPCVEFLKKQAENLGLEVTVCYPGNEKCPVVLMTWTGNEPELPSILLNSHMDVVPVDETRWTHKPFAADIDSDGNIFARGAQDDKSSGMQYLAAIRALKKDGVQQLKRTIHVTFVPDEEIGGAFGMKAFAGSDTFKALNVGFGLDESCACPFNKVFVFYAERTQFGKFFFVFRRSKEQFHYDN